MNDQAENAVEDPDAELLKALDAGSDEPEADEAEGEQEPEQAEAEGEAQDPAQTFKITVKNDAGDDEEREVTLDELAKGYMLQSDYTRKTQAIAQERAKVEQEVRSELSKIQQSAVDQINGLQELVIRQAAPDLEGVNWVSLSVEDPAKFVQLQAKQQALYGTMQALEQQKQNLKAQQEQQAEQLTRQALLESDAYLTKHIKGLDSNGTLKLLQDVEKHVGWTPQTLRNAARAMAQAGMPPETLGQVLSMAHDAIKLRELQDKRVVQKVTTAPKAIKPAAPQPKQSNQAAADRLRRHGRVEDLARLL